MSNRRLYLIFFVIFVVVTCILYSLNLPETSSILFILVGSLIIIMLEKIPIIRERIKEGNLENLIVRRKYSLLMLLNYFILQVARFYGRPKIFYLIGIALAIVSLISYFDEYKRKVEFRKIIKINTVLVVLALFLHTLNFLK